MFRLRLNWGFDNISDCWHNSNKFICRSLSLCSSSTWAWAPQRPLLALFYHRLTGLTARDHISCNLRYRTRKISITWMGVYPKYSWHVCSATIYIYFSFSINWNINPKRLVAYQVKLSVVNLPTINFRHGHRESGASTDKPLAMDFISNLGPANTQTT